MTGLISLLACFSTNNGARLSRVIVLVAGTFLLEVRDYFFVSGIGDFDVLAEEETRLSIRFWAAIVAAGSYFLDS